MVDGVEKGVPLTLPNIVLAVVVVITTVIAVRNLPGLLEVGPVANGPRCPLCSLNSLQVIDIRPGNFHCIKLDQRSLGMFAVVDCGTQRGAWFWFTGNGRQFYQQSDCAVRTTV